MKLQNFRSRFGRIVTAVSYVALALLFAMVVIIAVDVILRKAQIGRINGSNELTSFFMIPVCVLGIPVLQISHGHVWVNLFVNKFPYRFRNFWYSAIMLVETAVIALLAYGGLDRVISFYERSRTTDILHMPWWIFAVTVLVAFLEYFILSLIDTIQFFQDGIKNKEPAPHAEGWSDEDVKGI